MVLIMVERLLVKEGTSSADMYGSGVGSAVVKELMVRMSATEDAEVPSRRASNDPWLRARSGDEKVEAMLEVGVRGTLFEAGRPRPVSSAEIVRAPLDSDDFVKDEVRGSS